ncbi:MAG: class I SAM-dependent methyltransferase [Saprospiraceae bacterium]|nr:class I SAM-dependent methyltransferase [Saprospiraceae bacterium]
MSTALSWKDRVRQILPWKVYWKLKRLREEWKAMTDHDDLTALAKVYKTDKWGHHFYTPIYEKWFQHLRHKPISLLEIGVGGYTKTHQGGDSLRMWKRYFYKGNITGIDIYDKSALQENRIKIVKGDQTDRAFLTELTNADGPFDIIVDDGSHVQSHIITSFETLFPLMKPGSIYVIEDTQTSYWPKYEGSTIDMHQVPSAMNYFIHRVHGVNRSEWRGDIPPTAIPDEGIGSISFYHNLIFVVKKG